MSYKLVQCCRCKKLFSFNTRFLYRLKPEEDKKSEKKEFIVSCSHCGADNTIES